MADRELDNLIDELFPAEKKAAPVATKRDAYHQPASQVNWDDSSEEEDERKPTKPTTGAAPAQKPTTIRKFSGSWDDDSDNDDGRRQVLFPVPFPARPDPEAVVPCPNRCCVTNCGGAVGHPHPPLPELRDIAAGKNVTTDEKSMMWRKGAFYVGDPDVGNGCLDFHQPGGEGKGGCPFISCLKCNYVVVRLQGAAWNDHDGTVDLYLTTRNYYPDWSRLASTHPVGVPKAKTLGYALVANQNAAAYCCQCSWLTVKGEKETIETKMAEAVMAKSLDNNIFCSTLPNEGSTLRPPLWVCRGHFA